MEGESYVLRPMNCPHWHDDLRKPSSPYRDLPMRIGEIAHDFRYESSGTLKGIERGHLPERRSLCSCTPEQIKSEVADVCNLIFRRPAGDFNITDYCCVLTADSCRQEEVSRRRRDVESR